MIHKKSALALILLCATGLATFAANPSSERKSTNRGHEYVDLGLSVCWASCNLGADFPEQAGDYYAWGEISAKDSCTVWNYSWCDGFYWDAKFTRYGAVDGVYVLGEADDAASQAWGGRWRIPTHEEQLELMDKCEWAWTDDHEGTGVSGCVVSSRVPGHEGKSIFLPASGDKLDKTIRSRGVRGFYMSSTMIPGFDHGACNILFEEGKSSWMYSYRYYGLSVRPVLER